MKNQNNRMESVGGIFGYTFLEGLVVHLNYCPQHSTHMHATSTQT